MISCAVSRILKRFSTLHFDNALFVSNLARHNTEFCTKASPLTALSEDEVLLKESGKFAKDVIKPLVRKMDNESKTDQSVIDEMEVSFLRIVSKRIHVSRRIGKIWRPWSELFVILIVEELAKVDPSISALCDVHSTLVSPAIENWGSEEQRRHYLPRLTQNMVGSFCLSEAGAGSEAFALKSTALKQGGCYILNGSKLWITNSEQAGVFIVFANTDPSAIYEGTSNIQLNTIAKQIEAFYDVAMINAT